MGDCQRDAWGDGKMGQQTGRVMGVASRKQREREGVSPWVIPEQCSSTEDLYSVGWTSELHIYKIIHFCVVFKSQILSFVEAILV